jgi:hypothetical protein
MQRPVVLETLQSLFEKSVRWLTSAFHENERYSLDEVIQISNLFGIDENIRAVSGPFEVPRFLSLVRTQLCHRHTQIHRFGTTRIDRIPKSIHILRQP